MQPKIIARAHSAWQFRAVSIGSCPIPAALCPPSVRRIACVLAGLALVLGQLSASAQEWTAPVRGSWARTGGPAVPGEVVLAAPGGGCELVVDPHEPSAVRQAAEFLAGDIEKLSGYRPPMVVAPSGQRVAVRLATLDPARPVSAALARARLAGQWEAYQVLTEGSTVWLVGSNFRGTAYAAYTLSERLGIDPLYLWTGYTPPTHPTLALRPTNFVQGPPTFKYRGFFHDDEDILPRPFDQYGYPLENGTIPLAWYARYFETALRLRLNQVAPYVRVQRYHEVQKLASDWGLFYSSHHYDILLSNPYGFTRFGLGAARHAGAEWDWFKNREGMLNFWRGGVLENRDVDCIWPVGLRNTNDYGYDFPDGMSAAERAATFQEVIATQVRLTEGLLPPGQPAIFHFTLYTEMLDLYQRGKLDLPANVIIVWPDNNDGHMRALPQGPDRWHHGVYYHLAYFNDGDPTIQVTHIVSPATVAEQFQQIVRAGATEYMLVNVSELRDYVMEAREIAEICWNAPTALPPGPAEAAADRYVAWWSREYFGPAAAPAAQQTYRDYARLLDCPPRIWSGQTGVLAALDAMEHTFAGGPTKAIAPATLSALEQRDAAYRHALDDAAVAASVMAPEARRFFFENAELGLRIDWRQTQAAILLIRAARTPDLTEARRLCFEARARLIALEDELRRAERYPFADWYRETWIRRSDAPSNVHRSYHALEQFLLRNFLKG